MDVDAEAKTTADPGDGRDRMIIVVPGMALVYFEFASSSPHSQARGCAVSSASPKRVTVGHQTKKSTTVLPFEKTGAAIPDQRLLLPTVSGRDSDALSKDRRSAGDLAHSTQHYKSAAGKPAEIARQLGVAHIVEGKRQRVATSVRVNVQL